MSSYRIEIQHQHAQYCINRMEEQPRATLETASEAGALLNSEGRRRNHRAHGRCPAPSSVLPSHDFSRTQQRSRLKLKEKLGFAIPVGNFQTVQAGHGHAHCGQGDKPGEAPPSPVSVALVAKLPPLWSSVGLR